MPQDMVRSRRAVLFYHHVMSEEIRRRVQPLHVPKITVSLNKQVIMCVVLAQNLTPWEDAFCVGMADRSEQNLIFSPKKRLVDITPACSAGPPFLSAFKLLDFLIFILRISFYYPDALKLLIPGRLANKLNLSCNLAPWGWSGLLGFLKICDAKLPLICSSVLGQTRLQTLYRPTNQLDGVSDRDACASKNPCFISGQPFQKLT